MLYALHFSFSWVPKTSFTPLAEAKFLKTEAQVKSRTMEAMTKTSNNCKNKKKTALEPNVPSANAYETCLMHSPLANQTTAHATSS